MCFSLKIHQNTFAEREKGGMLIQITYEILDTTLGVGLPKAAPTRAINLTQN